MSGYVIISQIDFPPVMNITVCEDFRFIKKNRNQKPFSQLHEHARTFPTMTLMCLDHVSRLLKITPRLDANATKSISLV